MKTIIVIGNGMVGHKFCEKLVDQEGHKKYKIIVFGEELLPAYDRVHLSEFFENESAEGLALTSITWYEEHGFSLKLGELITEINSNKKQVTSHRGEVYDYDTLILATGSYPFVPDIHGKDKRGVFVYRTIDDLEQMVAYRKTLPAEANAVIIGGGLLGLEAGKAAMDMGLDTSVVEFATRLMPRQIDEQGSATLTTMIESLGIKVLTGRNTKTINGSESIESISFSDGNSVPADMLIISAGIRARDEIAKKAALHMGERGGVVVNAQMQTSDASIYAIGEVANYQGQCYGLVAPGYTMAQVVVNNLMGVEAQMDAEVDLSTKLKLIGIDVASFGDSLDAVNAYKKITVQDNFNNIYKRINICEVTNTLKGGILIGDAEQYNTFLQLYLNSADLGEQPEGLLLGEGAAAAMSIGDLPDSAVICTCESVTKGDLCCAIEQEDCKSMKALVTKTKATTGCGGCKPMVADILDHSLDKLGLSTKRTICEHFEYTRQELYDIIKFKSIKTYDEALNACGKGDGCEVCRPALASIFASIYNEIATKQEDIQDTNDRFLANIQRNGSYSVVPRVPGGEITPDKLIVLGEVAKKYDLYTKITGGQRIDLFGAKVNELPAIWKELTDAGFESGHAYGKALRTVKSCVGSTWCRYGLDESVSFAIELENRYKGIRSPHKLKGGVSGCIRECAEARCKDFGVIATEKGWNLYVCGNGGANPKHAQLLVEDIDNETCIKYVDRFLMYYIRTAAPLQRTAAWLEKLQGGMPYLIDVVVNDKLNIVDDLEKEMAGLVNTYKCEWKAVVDNPELQERFKQFVNTEDSDDKMVFVPMREQKMPKPW